MINKPLTVMTYEINPFYESDLKIEIEELFSYLTKRERAVLEMYFGLSDEEPHTLKELGEIFDLRPERVRQIKLKAIKNLHGHINVLDLL